MSSFDRDAFRAMAFAIPANALLYGAVGLHFAGTTGLLVGLGLTAAASLVAVISILNFRRLLRRVEAQQMAFERILRRST